MAWTGETPTYLFHYTEAEHAQEIVADGYFRVGPGANFGFGLYATDLTPAEATPEEIRAVCFEGDAPNGKFDGVVMLEGRHPHHRFEEVDRRVFLLPAQEGFGELIPLHTILVAAWLRVGDRWEEVQ